MAWVMQKRNELISAASDNARNWKCAYHLKSALIAAGWTLQGSGYGTAGASGVWDAGALDRWAAVPVLDLCWVGLQNGDGVQLILQCTGANLYMYWLKGAVYTSGTENTNTIPNRGAIPAAEVSSTAGWVMGIPVTGVDFYLQVATENDDSFWAWSSDGYGRVTCCTAVVKLTETKAADLNPYWSYRYGQANTTVFSVIIDSAATNTFSRHPTAGIKKLYQVLRYKLDATIATAFLPVDPNSSKEQLLDCLVGCTAAGFIHLKGKLPGLKACSGARTVGDTFASSTLVCVSTATTSDYTGYALPWSAGAGML